MLTFTFGAMGSGKSAYAMMTAHQRHRPHAATHRRIAVLATTLDRADERVTSRTGMAATALQLVPGLVTAEVFGTADTIVVDEAQFLTVADVELLADLSDEGREVICFGLRTDFRGQLFAGSRRLLELADEVRQIPLEPTCTRCNRQAVINARVAAGRIVVAGPQIALGDTIVSGSAAVYEPMCRGCWHEAQDPA